MLLSIAVCRERHLLDTVEVKVVVTPEDKVAVAVVEVEAMAMDHPQVA